MKIKVTIISINYKVEKELIACISSIIKSKPKISYEIIVVDNDKKSKIKKILEKKFPKVKYVKSPTNIGYSAGNNLGVKHASGEFVFFLNPDTVITKNAIDVLFNFIKENAGAGMVAPLLLDPMGNMYPSQGSDEYNFKSAIVTSSFINKLFPNNPISKKFFHKSWNKKDVEGFDVVPGTAFMIRRSVFERAQKFDEKFFLYFEEYDLAKRIKRLGYKNYIVPQAKVLHIWEASTKKREDIKKIFFDSRRRFFKKNYGILFTFVTELFLRLGPYELMVGLVLIASAFLGFFRIQELMTFIGDQGWFYLSAKNMLIDGKIPLVGIASSRPWLHQGPFWTYILAFFMWTFNFNPVSGAYASIFLGLLSVIGVYIAGSAIFSKRAGLIASLLYGTSPLIVFDMRMPYHTSPIPVFTIAFIFSLCRIIQNKVIYIPVALFLLGILYNFEIATVALWPVFFGVVGYVIIRNKNYPNHLLNKKNLILSAISIALPLLPMILYDVRNGFPQTLKFVAWIFYKTVSFFGYNSQHEFSVDKVIIMIDFLFNNFTKLIFASSNSISLIIFISLISWMIYLLFQKKERNNSYNFIFLSFFTPLTLIILNQTPSNAYLPILFPITILLISTFFDNLIKTQKIFIPTLVFLVIIILSNINFIFRNNFTSDKPSSRLVTLDKRIQAAKEILKQSQDKDYNLKGKGPGSEHASFTMNYEYLTWWLNKPPSKKLEKLQFFISETEKGIVVKKVTR